MKCGLLDLKVSWNEILFTEIVSGCWCKLIFERMNSLALGNFSAWYVREFTEQSITEQILCVLFMYWMTEDKSQILISWKFIKRNSKKSLL